MAFNYKIVGVADMDQRWDMLPNNGNMYCVPSSAINWMYHLDANAYPGAIKFGHALPFHVPFNISAMGSYMDTDAEDGTGTSDAIDGLLDWLDDRGVPALVYSCSAGDGDNVTYAGIRNMLKNGGHVMVMMGRYTLEDGEFTRQSGHAMTLVELKRNDDGEIRVGVHDPNQDDGNLNAQSATDVKYAGLKQETRNIEGDVLTVLRWGASTNPYRFIDGWIAILPFTAFTNRSTGVVTSYRFDLPTGKVVTRDIPLPFLAEVKDLAVGPGGAEVAVIARGTGEVWLLDVAAETWRRLENVDSARLLAYGGRRQSLYVIRGNEVDAFDEDGRRVGTLDAGVPIDAISYDLKHNRLLALVDSGKSLLAIAPALRVIGKVDAPALEGNGSLALSVNAQDGTIVVTRHGTHEAATMRWHATGAMATGRFRLLAQGATAATHAHRKGRLFVSEAGRIAAFDGDGNRIAESPFESLEAGPLLKVSRSFNVHDVTRSRRKRWRN